MDRVDRIFADFVADLKARLEPPQATANGRAGSGAGGRASMRQQLQQILDLPTASFRDLSPANAAILVQLCRALLRRDGAWLDSSAVLKAPNVKEILGAVAPAEQLHHYARAVRLLKLCKLLQMGLGTNPHGTPLIFAVKRVLPSAQDPAYVYYSNALSAFGLRVGGRGSEYKAIDHTAADVPRPPAAPALAFEAVLTREESADMCAVIRAVAAPQPEA